ncbi:copper homeostasis protein CutC [Microbacterium gilvum]|uniref:PF03932 family protein CutC n=1 Tax=Microbacterium gilvum TaxID=1336204 RepID=A0ABP9ARQ6_9MICO
MTAFELAVQDAAGIAVAARVGADRVELASALALGGLTPSPAVLERAVGSGTPVHVLVRPRAGGFAYDPDDRALMVADVRWAVREGAAGVVVGGTAAGTADADLVRACIDAADGREVTFHRAFDTVSDRMAALDALAELGITRVLTSGGASRAVDALAELRALVERAAGCVQIMAGGGVDAVTARRVAAAGVDAVHASAKRVVVDDVPIGLGSASGAGGVAYETADEDAALAIRLALAS